MFFSFSISLGCGRTLQVKILIIQAASAKQQILWGPMRMQFLSSWARSRRSDQDQRFLFWRSGSKIPFSWSKVRKNNSDQLEFWTASCYLWTYPGVWTYPGLSEFVSVHLPRTKEEMSVPLSVPRTKEEKILNLAYRARCCGGGSFLYIQNNSCLFEVLMLLLTFSWKNLFFI